MSARDELEHALTRGVHLGPDVRRRLIDKYAHELAELIRANKCDDTSPDGVLCPCGAAAADLIDPEVNSGS